MKEWTHDKLHQLIDNDSALRAKSNEVHNMPTPKSLDEWEKQKRQMMRLYAKTIGCEGFVDAENFLNKVLGYIKQHCSCLEDWRNIALLQKHREALQALGESFKEHKKCCSPKGNDYICYCDKLSG